MQIDTYERRRRNARDWRYERADGTAAMDVTVAYPPATLRVAYSDDLRALRAFPRTALYQVVERVGKGGRYHREWPDGGARYRRVDGQRGTIYTKSGVFVGRPAEYLAVL